MSRIAGSCVQATETLSRLFAPISFCLMNTDVISSCTSRAPRTSLDVDGACRRRSSSSSPPCSECEVGATSAWGQLASNHARHFRTARACAGGRTAGAKEGVGCKLFDFADEPMWTPQGCGGR